MTEIQSLQRWYIYWGCFSRFLNVLFTFVYSLYARHAGHGKCSHVDKCAILHAHKSPETPGLFAFRLNRGIVLGAMLTSTLTFGRNTAPAGEPAGKTHPINFVAAQAVGSRESTGTTKERSGSVPPWRGTLYPPDGHDAIGPRKPLRFLS